MKNNTFKMRCVDSDIYSSLYTTGQIYDVIDGVFTYGMGESYISDFNSFCRRSSAKWELIEEQSLMDVIYEKLGIKDGEVFRLDRPDDGEYDREYRFENGILFAKDCSVNDWFINHNMLAAILTGLHKVIKQKWKPQKGEFYYFITKLLNEEIVVARKSNDNYYVDKINFKIHNYFKTKEEVTQKHIDAYVEWLNKEEDIFANIK